MMINEYSIRFENLKKNKISMLLCFIGLCMPTLVYVAVATEIGWNDYDYLIILIPIFGSLVGGLIFWEGKQ